MTTITPWTLTPDWTSGITETLEFKTDVSIAWSGAEQRRAVRIAPRRTFEFDAQLRGQSRRLIEGALFAGSSQVWGLPIWPDGQNMTSALAPGATVVPCDTVNRDFVNGGTAIILTSASTYEVLQVETVSSTQLTLSTGTVNSWPVNAKLFPLRQARLPAWPKLSRANGDFATAQVKFLITEACDWTPASGLPTYRTYPVIEDSPDAGQGDQASFEREARTIDSDTGIFEVDDTAGIGFPTLEHYWWLSGRTARANFRALLYLLKGRQGAIWLPTYQTDLKLTGAAAATDTTLTVEASGYTANLLGQINRQDIRIELYGGTVLYRRITGATQPSTTTEVLTVDSALGTAFTAAQVRRISFMALCRQNADAVAIQHHTAADGLATAATTWRALGIST